ncbi:MAG: hypothetical protein KGL12_09095, partial [Rhodospirillales bacterium]|nr:hypothetical protein [Rhodospirillales bacterium]
MKSWFTDLDPPPAGPATQPAQAAAQRPSGLLFAEDFTAPRPPPRAPAPSQAPPPVTAAELEAA